jgi:3-oxoacyl-[acyl-carrier-protein] synthase II
MNRVVVTGWGLASPLGNAVEPFLDGLLAGRSGVRAIRTFDASALPTRIAGECDLDAAGAALHRDRKVAFALHAGRQAMRTGPRTGRSSVVFGVGLELFHLPDLARLRRLGRIPDGVDPDTFLQSASDESVFALSRLAGATCPGSTHISACAAGTDALGHGFHLVAEGRRDWVLAGGTDSMVNPLGVAGFCALSATSTRNEAPEKASRPFDRTRDGFVMGEGAGALVLESMHHARARGAEILGEIVGYGSSLDAHAISEPHPEGKGAAAAMRAALADAGLKAEDIGAINAHGTSTPKNDPAETMAIRAVFGEGARRIPVSATKSMIGHLISAAGAVEAIAALGTMNRGFVHPTINLDEPDPACDLDYVPHVARAHDYDHVLSTSYGFGGHNAAIILRSRRACLAD